MVQNQYLQYLSQFVNRLTTEVFNGDAIDLVIVDIVGYNFKLRLGLSRYISDSVYNL